MMIHYSGRHRARPVERNVTILAVAFMIPLSGLLSVMFR